VVRYVERHTHHDSPGLASKFSDGRIGWRKLPIRAQRTIDRWIFDESGGIQGYIQQDPMSFKRAQIPISKSLLFRTTSNKANPEGRALALDTPVPTPDGFRPIEALEVGDKVFDEKGRIRYVSGKSEVWKSRPCYEVEFSTGEVIVADENHLWVVTTANDRSNGKPARILRTSDLFEWQHRSKQGPTFSVGEMAPLDYPEQCLPVDPYILGYWLGDGTHTSGEITVHPDDADSLMGHLRAAGYVTRYKDIDLDWQKGRVYSDGLLTDLRKAGVYANKHIPQAYLRGSVDQRLALLQGLMDSDGTSPQGQKPSRFTNSNPKLIEGTAELVRSLGMIARVHVQQEAGVRNVLGTVTACKESRSVTFWPEFPVHRLQRKLEQQSPPSLQSRSIYIRDVRHTSPTDTVCIQVDSPTHMFLAGQTCVPTHNSLLRGAWRAWYFKKRLQEIEAIGIERDLAGLPIGWVPVEWLSENPTPDQATNLARMKKLVTNIRRDEQEGVIMPLVYDDDGSKLIDLTLLATGGSRQFDTNEIILRYDRGIAGAVLADFVMLGHETTGTFSLSKDKTSLFMLALNSLLDSIASVFNRHAIPRLFQVNGIEREAMPELVHGAVEKIELGALGNFLRELSQAGAGLFPDERLENTLRQMANLPERDPEAPPPLPELPPMTPPSDQDVVPEPAEEAAA
jgi:hypothetical protein